VSPVRLRARLAALVLSFAVFCAGAARAERADEIRIALIPDPQNYCTTARIDANKFQVYDEKLAMEQLDAQIRDVIAQRPAFALVLGDLTDTTGGPDQNRAAGNQDDPNSAAFPNDAEWKCYVEHVPKPLEAAGIPYLEITGNHDSCVDYERWRPRAAFLEKPWAHAAESIPGACGKDFANTEQRAALFPTPLTPICVVGVDYRSASGRGERDFILANAGCGGGHPTIVLRHSQAAAPQWMSNRALKDVFMTAEGHFVTRLPFMTMLDPGPLRSPAGYSYVRAGINMQEISMNGNGKGCRDASRVAKGSCMHTGLSWWGLVTVTPARSQVVIKARAPWLGGRTDSHLPALYTVPFSGKKLTLEPAWCERFPKTQGC
jgi:hypothetical protein